MKQTNKKLLKLNKYNCESNERPGSKRGGGVGIAVAKDLIYVRRKDLESNLKSMELCIIELICQRSNIIVASIYHPPNSSKKVFLKEYELLIKYLKSDNSKDIIIGIDSNFDLLKSYQHNSTKKLLDITIDFDLWPTITKLTRITKSSATLIDNIMVNSRIYDSYQCGIILSDLSDHLPCILIVHNAKMKHKPRKAIWCRKITKKTLEQIKTKLASENLTGLSSKGTVNDAFDIVHEKILGVIDKIAPYESYLPGKCTYRKEPWLLTSLLKCIKKQKKLYALSISRFATEREIEHYKDYRNTLTKLKRYCKCKYYNEKCTAFKGNTKALWHVINKITSNEADKSSVIASIKDGVTSYNNQDKIATILNNHFSSIGRKYASQIKQSKRNIKQYLTLLKANTCSMFWDPVSKAEILRIIDSLPNKKSSGYDQIDNILLKEIKEQIAPALCILFNRSISEGIFPDSMKMAEVVVLHKGKERDLCTNYRPISLLITVSKILEKVVYSWTYNFLNDTNQIYDSQYGFCAKHSCEHAVQELIGHVLKGYEWDQKTSAVFLDLSKAFDTISHSVLFNKMEIYGIRGTNLAWFKSYLSNRQMRVKCTGENSVPSFSEFKIIEYGCPQGSVLGPLIFLIFNNDLNLHLSFSNCLLFADDTTIYLTHKDLRHLAWCIREDLATITDWFQANKLTLNLDKSVMLLFNKGKPITENKYLKEVGLPVSDHAKFLGILLDNSLNWNQHFNHVHLMLKCNIKLLKKGKKFLNVHAKKNLYYGHIYSHLTYGMGSNDNPKSNKEATKDSEQMH